MVHGKHEGIPHICSVIGANTGKVIDIEVLSITCKGCESWNGERRGTSFEEWQKKTSQTSKKKSHWFCK